MGKQGLCRCQAGPVVHRSNANVSSTIYMLHRSSKVSEKLSTSQSVFPCGCSPVDSCWSAAVYLSVTPVYQVIYYVVRTEFHKLDTYYDTLHIPNFITNVIYFYYYSIILRPSELNQRLVFPSALFIILLSDYM